MRFLSTQNQGAAAYIAVPGWTRPASAGWTVGFTCRIFSIATEQIILGNSGNNTSMFSVMPDGSLKYRDSGVNQIVSAAGVITPNQFYTFLFRRVGSVLELWLGPDGMRDDLVGGTKIGETGSLTQALFNPVNQFGRYYNSSTNTPIEIKRFWTIGGSYTDTWTPAGVQNTSTTWISKNLSRSLTISGATGATNSWWTQYPNASDVSKVGSGWSVDEVDYLSVFHWMQELKTSSVYVTAHCKGEAAPISISTPTIAASDFPAGCLIRGDVEYNGANHALLTTWARQISVASSSGLVTVQDFYNTSASSGLALATVINGNKLKRLCLQQTADPGSNAATLMVSLDAIAENCVVINTLSTASKVIRPSDRGIIRNCIGVGAKHALFSEWTSSKTEKSYGVGASIASCIWENGRPVGNITNASEDATGDVGYQNLDPVSNFVDYANGDYRIRTTSPLYSAGIGAFFEEAGAAAVEGSFTDSAIVQLFGLAQAKESISYLEIAANIATQYLYEAVWAVLGSFSSVAIVTSSKVSSKNTEVIKPNSSYVATLSKVSTKEARPSIPAITCTFSSSKSSAKTALTSKNTSTVSVTLGYYPQKNISTIKPVSSASILGQYYHEIFFGITGSFLESLVASFLVSGSKEVTSSKQPSIGTFGGVKSYTKESLSVKPTATVIALADKVVTKESVSPGIYSQTLTASNYTQEKYSMSDFISEISITWNMYGTSRTAIMQVLSISSKAYMLDYYSTASTYTMSFSSRQY